MHSALGGGGPALLAWPTSFYYLFVKGIAVLAANAKPIPRPLLCGFLSTPCVAQCGLDDAEETEHLLACLTLVNIDHRDQGLQLATSEEIIQSSFVWTFHRHFVTACANLRSHLFVKSRVEPLSHVFEEVGRFTMENRRLSMNESSELAEAAAAIQHNNIDMDRQVKRQQEEVNDA